MQRKGLQDYLLLQINDGLFPIGGYSHSYGLETYIQKGIVHDRETANLYLQQKLGYAIINGDLLCARLAYEAAAKEELGELLELEEIAEASMTAKEIRMASHKLASRFYKTIHKMQIQECTLFFEKYVENVGIKNIHYPVIYGVFTAACGIEKIQALEHYLYAQASAMVTNCVKTIPLSQLDGQDLLYIQMQSFPDMIKKMEESTKDRLYLSMPGFDIRCMQHETLYSRIYMS